MSVEKSRPSSRLTLPVPTGSFKAERVELSFSAERVPRRAAAPPIRLDAEHVQEALRALPAWRLTAGRTAIYRSFRFPASGSSLAFVRLVTAMAEELAHPPVLRLNGPWVTCRLSTPQAGGITVKDLRLARCISLLG